MPPAFNAKQPTRLPLQTTSLFRDIRLIRGQRAQPVHIQSEYRGVLSRHLSRGHHHQQPGCRQRHLRVEISRRISSEPPHMVGRAQLALSEVEWGTRRYVMRKTACKDCPALPTIIPHPSPPVSVISVSSVVKERSKDFSFFLKRSWFFSFVRG
jgi:hypothetical protein